MKLPEWNSAVSGPSPFSPERCVAVAARRHRGASLLRAHRDSMSEPRGIRASAVT